jgi:methylmalonyl-CoA mutase, N-terminal domain
MSEEAVQLSLPGFEQAYGGWRADYSRQIGSDRVIKNRSRIEIKPLYTPRDWVGDAFLDNLGFPGQYPYTRGIYPTMHRGRTWTQRQLIGLGTPEDYNKRVRVILDAAPPRSAYCHAIPDSAASIATKLIRFCSAPAAR